MNNSSAVYSILERYVPRYMLSGYAKGIIDENNEKLYAYTYVIINPEAFQNHYTDWGCSIIGVDDEKTRIYLDGGKSYQHKNAAQCIQEGIYKCLSIKFYGCFYENRWYILKELAYFGELITKEDAIVILSDGIQDTSVLNRSSYLPIDVYYPQWNPAEPLESRGVEYDEFIGMPELAAHISQEEKYTLLRAHSTFVYLDVFAPVLNMLRATRFETYNEYYPSYPVELSLIFSKERNFAILPLMVMNSKQEYRLCYFFWHDGEKKIYEWQYFQSAVYEFSFHYADEIIAGLSGITYWNDTAFLYSSCTLDDENFWQNYVLAKSHNKYTYLTEPG